MRRQSDRSPFKSCQRLPFRWLARLLILGLAIGSASVSILCIRSYSYDDVWSYRKLRSSGFVPPVDTGGSWHGTDFFSGGLNSFAGHFSLYIEVVRIHPPDVLGVSKEDGLGFRAITSTVAVPASYNVSIEEQLIRMHSGMAAHGFGIAAARKTEHGLDLSFALLAPDWVIILLLLALPAFRFYRYVSKRKDDDALLRCACGYDLRASPDRCPECGRERNGRSSMDGEAKRYRVQP